VVRRSHHSGESLFAHVPARTGLETPSVRAGRGIIVIKAAMADVEPTMAYAKA
jgi:hypothetical protein